MNWLEQVTILDLLVKGFIIGIVVSAPLGPVGVLCIQRTLNKGRWFGFVTGLGAALSDIIYSLITGYGMSFGKRGSYLHNFITAFFVTLSNPLIIFLFVGLFARFSFVMPGSPVGFQLVGYLAIILGALTWWFSITYFVNKVRNHFNVRGIWVLNRVIGIIVIVASIIGLVLALLGNSIY